MLGPVGTIARRALNYAGYELYKPTDYERRLVSSLWEDWLSHDPALFARIYAGNREALRRVKSWADEIDDSLWRYGVPEEWSSDSRELGKTALDEVEAEITYSDLIGFIASQISNLSYLEIGVSVGKNFWQIAELFPDADLYALDVEEPNPSLVRLFDKVEIIREGEIQEVDTLSGEPSTIRLTHYRLHRQRGKPVTYVRGDQFSIETWRSISHQFNFIFSDGVHTGDALRSELDHIEACDLIDKSDRAAVYWDDLVNTEMQSAFEDNSKRLGFPHYAMHWIHGTYGNRRLNGVCSNFVM